MQYTLWTVSRLWQKRRSEPGQWPYSGWGRPGRRTRLPNGKWAFWLDNAKLGRGRSYRSLLSTRTRRTSKT